MIIPEYTVSKVICFAVMPAQASIFWNPACAGMTSEDNFCNKVLK